jgi:hypothetical protein
MALTTPKEVFFVPTEEQVKLNSDFWTGNANGIPKAMTLTFWNPPVGKYAYTDWWTYTRQFVKPLYLKGFPVAYNDGYDDAFETATFWLWFNDPNSPHIKVYE